MSDRHGTISNSATVRLTGDRDWHSLADLRAGDSIGCYRLVDRVARGGMGEVWRAVDEQLNRDVALKLLLNHDEVALSRFAREAHIAAQLDHPHIAKVFNFCHQPAFLAMQLIDGVPVDEAPGNRIRAIRDAAMAVHHAHERQVLHRDLKPSNILVDRSGFAVVVDFGLARATSLPEDQRVTVSGEILGTPAYMAPEQARGRHEQIDERTDVYGLGATLYHVLAGHAPFDGATAWDTVEAVLSDDPPPSRADPELDLIARMALSKDPERRYQSAKAFAQDLDRWLRQEPIAARPPSAWYRLSRSVKRRPAIWGLATALVLTLLIGFGYSFTKFVEAKRSFDQFLMADRMRQENLNRALEAEERERSEKAGRSELMQLQETVERFRRRLGNLDDRLALRLSDAELATTHELQRELEAELSTMLGEHPEEGVLEYLRGRLAMLRFNHTAAVGAFVRALEGADAPLSQALEIESLASVALARALLRRDVYDNSVETQWFRNEGRRAEKRNLVGMLNGLLSGGATDSLTRYEARVARLWQLYIAAIANRFDDVAEIRREAADLAARGGRRNEDLHVLRGLLAVNDDLAISAFSDALDRFHAQPKTFVLRASALVRQGAYAAALEDCERALVYSPDYVLAQFIGGVCALELELYDQSREMLDAVIAAVGDEPMPLMYRGWLAQREHDLGMAWLWFRRAARAAQYKPDFTDPGLPAMAMAEICREVNMWEQAERCYREAIDAGYEPAIEALARLYEAADQHTDAELLIREAVEGDLDFFAGMRLRLLQAEIQLKTGRLIPAKNTCDWLLNRHPGRPDYVAALLLRSRVLQQLDQHNQSLFDLDSAVYCVREWEMAVTSVLPEAQRQLAVEVYLARARQRMADGEFEPAWIDVRNAERHAGMADRAAVLALRAEVLHSRGDAVAAKQARLDSVAADLDYIEACIGNDQLNVAADRLHGLLNSHPGHDRARAMQQEVRLTRTAVRDFIGSELGKDG